MRIPLTTSLKIERFIGGEIIVASSQVINGIFDKYPDGRWFVTQRPGINLAIDASADGVTTGKGRGTFDWAAVDARYWVNGSEVYKGNHSTTVRESAKSVTITQAGGTATATNVGHGFDIDDEAVIAGAAQAGYNGTQTILSVPTADTFTFAVDAGTVSPATGTITARRSFRDGTGRVYFFEVGAYLVILDPDNNVGWYISSAATTTLVKTEDPDFPANISGKTLAKGGAVINKTLFVMDTDGEIAGSGIETPVTWDGLNFTEAELKTDGGVAIWEHDETVLAFGNRTIELFYYAGNPTGSPLSVRTDISFPIGCADEHTLASESGSTFFIGITQRSGLGAYMISGMTPQKISTTDIDSFLTTSIIKEAKSAIGAAVSVGGRIFYAITLYHLNSGLITPLTTLVYNATTKTWTTWELMHAGIDCAPFIDFTLSTRTDYVSGILTNGDIMTIEDDFIPQDRTLATSWVASGWVEPGWVSSSGQAGDDIEITVITGAFDGGNNNSKSADSYRLAGTQTEASQPLSLYWSDQSNRSYQATPRTLDMGYIERRATRCGSFIRRNHKLVGTPSERVALEGLEMEGTEADG